MYFVQSKPKLPIQATKASFVVSPVEIEINRAIQSFLEHSPPPTSCCLVTENIEGTRTVRVDRVDATALFAWIILISTVFSICKINNRVENWNASETFPNWVSDDFKMPCVIKWYPREIKAIGEKKHAFKVLVTQRKYLEGQGGTTRIVERYGKRFWFSYDSSRTS